LLGEEKIPADNNRLSATYNRVWLSAVTISSENSKTSFGDVELGNEKEMAFETVYPVLAAFPDATRKDAANTMLRDYFGKATINLRSCANGIPSSLRDGNDVESSIQVTRSVTFASASLLSIQESGSIYCGGAHPNNFDKRITFDLNTMTLIGGEGQDLTPDSFGRIMKLANKQERAAFERFALDRWKAGAEKDPEMAADCIPGWIDDSPEGEKEFSLSFTKEGLAVQRTDYPHAISVCLFQDFNPAIIPWADLKPFLRRDQTLLQLP
jgi:hypothetical protein